MMQTCQSLWTYLFRKMIDMPLCAVGICPPKKQHTHPLMAIFMPTSWVVPFHHGIWGTQLVGQARKLWARLNLDPSVITGGHYNAVDPLWQHPETRAVFYVGNQTAASNLPLLQKHGITHVVNCTDNMPNYHEGSSSIRYHRFDISRFHRQVKTDADADRFVQAMLDFVGLELSVSSNDLGLVT